MVLHTINSTPLLLILICLIFYSNAFQPHYGHPQADHPYTNVYILRLYKIICPLECNLIPTSSSHSTVICWFCEKVFSDDDIHFGEVCCTVNEVDCDMQVYRLCYYNGYCTIHFFKTGVLCPHTGQSRANSQSLPILQFSQY